MKESISKRQFSIRVGCSAVWIGKLVAQGRLPTDENGNIPLEEGLRAYEATKTPGYEFNRQRAAAIRAETAARRAGKTGQDSELVSNAAEPVKKRGPGRPRKSESTLKTARSTPIPLPAEVGDVDLDNPASVNEAFNKARALEKIAQANLRKLEYQQLKGKLLPVDEVERETKAVVAVVYSKILGVPTRVSGRCEGRTSGEIEAIIRDELNVALSDFQRWAQGEQ